MSNESSSDLGCALFLLTYKKSKTMPPPHPSPNRYETPHQSHSNISETNSNGNSFPKRDDFMHKIVIIILFQMQNMVQLYFHISIAPNLKNAYL